MIGFGLLLSAWIASTAVVNLVTRAARIQGRLPGAATASCASNRGAITACCWLTWACRCSSCRRHRGQRLPAAKAMCACSRWRNHVSRGGTPSRMQDCARGARGPNYMAAQAIDQRSRTTAEAGDHAVRPERRIYNVSAFAHDRSCHRSQPRPRPLRRARRAGGRPTAWSVRVHHKPLVNLDLARLPADGRWWLPRGSGPALPRAASAAQAAERTGSDRFRPRTSQPRPLSIIGMIVAKDSELDETISAAFAGDLPAAGRLSRRSA